MFFSLIILRNFLVLSFLGWSITCSGGPSSTITPSSIKTTLVATFLAKEISCVTTTIVIPESAIFFIGHVTKDGYIAGPKIVEHIVDTVLYFESAESGMRLLRASKNRFGSVDEIGLFSMDQSGLHGVKDPSSVFLASRRESGIPSGIAFTSVVEGSRTFAVEIQALVVPAKTGLQRIYSDRIDTARVSRVAAILQKHAGLMLSDQDIYVNVAGGIKLSEVSIELALALALYSSKEDIPLRSSSAAFGELSLAGEVRRVAFADRRMKNLEEMGFSEVLSGETSGGRKSVGNIKAALIAAFSNRRG